MPVVIYPQLPGRLNKKKMNEECPDALNEGSIWTSNCLALDDAVDFDEA
jgi:hypothetical protein